MPFRDIENKVRRSPAGTASERANRAVREMIQKVQSAAEPQGFVPSPPEHAVQGFDCVFAVVFLKAVVRLLLVSQEIRLQIVRNADADIVLLPMLTKRQYIGTESGREASSCQALLPVLPLTTTADWTISSRPLCPIQNSGTVRLVLTPGCIAPKALLS